MSADKPPEQPSSSAKSAAYSRAFQTFVAEPNDLVGLLAYARYKQNIRQNRVEGVATPQPGDRTPGATEIEAYRGLAERSLERYLENVIGPFKAEWVEEGRLASIDEATERIIGAQRGTEAAVVRAVGRGTNFWLAVLAGIVAWLASIGVTILVVYAAQDWVFQVLHVTVVREHGGN